MDAEKVALAVAGIVLAVILVNAAKPVLFDAALPVMQQAGAGDSCVVVEDGCHGKRYAVNSEYVSTFRWLRPRPDACTEVLMPIDALVYGAVNNGEKCVLEARVSPECQGSSDDFCKRQRKVVENGYN